jgi:hypothetical protein
MIEGLWLRIGPFIRLALPRSGHLRHSMACHWTALAALRRRDAAASRAAISDDISGAADDLEPAADRPAGRNREGEKMSLIARMRPEPGLRVLVTAGAGGIGKAIAEAFLEADARVHICDVSQAAIDTFLQNPPGRRRKPCGRGRRTCRRPHVRGGAGIRSAASTS